ncbi:DegV family protein [Lachnoclostridium phocaeense]|uniref:DegV family protein n=1 Tax=Lachnoclostridium phocaeense TaxID=1871021 RepID=UPI00248E8693|nr:DegV family protein [Lachnoclostridium phocaeense]
MADFVITTDSNSDVPEGFLVQHDIPVIPQYYMFGETVYGDEIKMEPSEFYETMRKGELPKSMANNPEVIREKFTKILKEGKDILHIAFSSALSGSCQNVQVAARDLMEDYPERKILVFDSLNASLGEGVSVMRAVQLKEEGRSMEEIYDILAEERAHVNVCFTVDDLHHLQRGGRVSKTTAVVGSMINIKPLLTVTSTGELKSDGTVRGRKKALKTLVTRMEQCLDTEHFGKDRPVAIVHGDCIDDALAVQEHVKELGFENVVINDVSPSIGTHAGPGVVGLIFYGKTVK